MTQVYKIMGINDAVTVCDHCGKSNLKCTVELETECGEIVHFGRDCAGAAVYGRKNKKNTDSVSFTARVASAARTVLPVVLDCIAKGMDMNETRKVIGSQYGVTFGYYTDTGNKMPLRIYALSSNKAGVEIAPSDY